MKKCWAIVIFLGLACSREPMALRKQLHDHWTFQQEGTLESIPAQVPGTVHLDLFRQGIIDDPFWEDNERKQGWIEEENWLYRTVFDLSEEEWSFSNIELVMEGLDTYAEVRLNDSLILTANNMFRSWTVEVKKLLKRQDNVLEIRFLSPIQYHAQTVAEHPHRLPSGNEAEDIAIKVSPFTRKAAYHFGWDWGPRFVTSGIWRPVYLYGWHKVRLMNVAKQTLALEKDKAKLLTQVEIQCAEAGDYQLQIGEKRIHLHLEQGVQTISDTQYVHHPQLWWCNGMGEPHLYTEEVSVWKGQQEQDRFSHQYGIRTIALRQEADSIGTAFYFELNGQKVFAKGANYIPQDVFLPRVSNAQYRHLLRSAKAAHMNMLRVWGGGVYEKDLFYALCDSMGIMVWQDFMFAGSLYPADEAFLENVAQEVEDNVKRLRKHPCLALWCGNNEIEVAWKHWGWQQQYGYSQADSLQLWKNYERLFEEVIPERLGRLQPELPYVATTPLSNWGKPENFAHGSMHYWGVWHGRQPFEAFEKHIGRFMVEYGFQSYPHLSTLRKAIGEENLRLEAPIMAQRQKSYIGNGLIEEHIAQYYSAPEDFADFVEKSQAVQALGLSMAIEAHRNAQPHCMGTLFWQLNDCWPGPSWSVIDYYGEKKKAYYAVQAAFAD